ncbi:AAA family ATPase [Pseudoxanthomonas sp. PXM03]|uniref:AAA family ATPase n=1 Tax=Pseudoxanthomonas sp. PXM03 TaxID=2769284 RepID=UPI00177FDAA2|nr:AAA family ATPase [Pseudoxanthomonas sp. PXM03]MBD9435732.1 AAA family ATPase [Pseudoxanthomonas sp. PXM03]
MKSRYEIPSGYTNGEGELLVPTRLAYRFAQDRLGQVDDSKPSVPPVSESAVPPLVPVARKSRAHRVLQVYTEQDVQEMEASLESLARSNDRRKNGEAMVRQLRKTQPVGQRVLARVPRAFHKYMDLLEAEMPNFRQVVATVRRLLALQVAGDGSFYLPPMLLAGDPGVGKTYFAMRLARLMGTGFEMVSMEGASSPMSLIGLEQHYYTSSPGKVFDVLVQGQSANPVFVVDELDKASSEARFPPANALYQLLESETAKRFCDQSCLQVKLDASRISWVVTANDLSAIPVPILSRLSTFHVPTPARVERVQIAGTIYRDLRQQMAWGKRFGAVLPQRSACKLADVAGSVRPMKSLLRLACANAYLRKSSSVEPGDIEQALRCAMPLPDLEQLETGGCA